jgi:hypothetical protein
MMGLPYDLPEDGEVHIIQNPNENKLKTLDEYPLFKAQEMITVKSGPRPYLSVNQRSASYLHL